jgi:hypothetical protein
VKVDPAMRKRYRALVAELRRARAEGAEAFDALWEAAAEIVEHDPPLYVVGGYESDAAFFEGELGEKARNAYRYMRVAKLATPREERDYGTTKLDAALAYLEAKIGAPLAHPPLPVAFDRLRIPVKTAGGVEHVTLADARVEDITAATRALQKKDRQPTSSAERALREALAKHAILADVTVRVRNGLATFAGVPVGAMGAFTSAVSRARWDAKAAGSSPRATTKRGRRRAGARRP